MGHLTTKAFPLYGSLFWIEWLDRLHRVLNSTRQDVALLSRAISPRALASLERSRRQLAALSNDLQLLDRRVLGPVPAGEPADAAGHLQTALATALEQLDSFLSMQPSGTAAAGEGALGRLDAALRDSGYEASQLLAPRRRAG